MYSFCKAKITGTCFKLFSKEEADQTREYLEKRYLSGRTVPGTRMYHHFIPVSSNTISFKKKQVLIHVLKYLILFQKTKIIKRFR